MSDELNEKIDAYYSAREAYDQAHKLSSEADALRRQKERELVDYMIEHQLLKVSREDGTTPMLVSSVSIACNQENAEELESWLADQAGDVQDFKVTVLHKPTVLDYVKKRIKDGDDPADFPAFLKCDSRPILRVDGWKSR